MALERRSSEDVPDFSIAIAMHSIGDVEVVLYAGLTRTLARAKEELGQGDIVKAYRFLSGDERLDYSFHAATQVVLGEVQNAWYEASGKDIPAQVVSNQEQRLKEALVAKKDEAAAEGGKAKEPRITNRSIIETGLLAGDDEATILKAVKKQFPDGKADASHVKYYRHFLVKAGKLQPLPKKEKVAKEKPVKTITEAAAEGSTAKGKAIAPKTTASKPAKSKT